MWKRAQFHLHTNPSIKALYYTIHLAQCMDKSVSKILCGSYKSIPLDMLLMKATHKPSVDSHTE